MLNADNRSMCSPFNDILHTNAVPSDTECEEIRNLLEGSRKELSDVTEEINRLQSMIDEAARKRDRLQQFIDVHLALLSPVRRLPDDVVREVFIATLPSSRNPAISSDEGPLLLCGICKSWRAVALATPRLWASIHIVIPAASKLQAALVSLVATWFERSGTVPLEISMVYSKIWDPEPDSCDLSPFLSTLAAASRRWRNLQLILPNPGADSLFASLSPEDVPLLQTVALCNTPSAASHDTSPLAFLASTSLRSITFTGIQAFVHSPVSWGTLTHLSFTRAWPTYSLISCAEALVILRQCIVLQSFELNVWDAGEEGINIPVSLPQLLHLSVTSNALNIGFDFFSHITVPNLRSFHLVNSYNVDLPRLIPLVGSMECLRLKVEGLGSENLLEALGSMPLLQELVVSAEPRTKEQVEDTSWQYWKVVEGDRDFLTHLTPCSDDLDATLCPVLRRVEFQNFSSVSDESLLRFILSRTKECNTDLSQVIATFRRPLQFDIIPHLQDAVARGVVVSLKYDDEPGTVVTYSPREGSENPLLYMLSHLQ
ncbi:hypothetical protein B0H13DRAFT_2316545 [Mycena leptocephala]|nr:hypothetical protein B0H13DRAFT_2316545 [Mycena leptocephala]